MKNITRHGFQKLTLSFMFAFQLLFSVYAISTYYTVAESSKNIETSRSIASSEERPLKNKINNMLDGIRKYF